MKKITAAFICVYLALAFISCQKKVSNSVYDNGRPKLIIGIVVDQMAYDYTQRYWDKFSAGGFKRLFTGGFVCKNAFFEHFPTYTGPGHTCIFTGNDPGISGIAANDWYDRALKKEVYCAEDDSVKTVGSFSSAGKMSPKNMLVLTIGDRLKLTSNFKSRSIGISLKDRAAILPAGRLADEAYWYDAASKYWISSTYYMKELPEWVNKFNSRHLEDQYLSSDWNTLLPIEQYTESTPDDNAYERTYNGEDKPVFPHKFPELRYRNTHLLQYSPFGNSIEKEFTIDAIKNLNLGKGDATDFLCLSFSSTDYVGHMFGPYSVEAEDTYLRLDKDLADMFTFLDEYIGMDKVLIFLTADHGNSPNPIFLRDHRIDAGAFHYGIIKDSCNAYLKRVFGLENAAVDVINQQVYLDHDLIRAKASQLNIIEDSVAAFITTNIEGVKEVYTAHDLEQNNKKDVYAKNFFNGYYQPRSGDVLINFRPYWIEENLQGTEHGSPYNYDTHVPLVWYGWRINEGSTGEYAAIKDIVPTLANILSIDVPEESTGKPIQSMLNSIRK